MTGSVQDGLILRDRSRLLVARGGGRRAREPRGLEARGQELGGRGGGWGLGAGEQGSGGQVLGAGEPEGRGAGEQGGEGPGAGGRGAGGWGQGGGGRGSDRLLGAGFPSG